MSYFKFRRMAPALLLCGVAACKPDVEIEINQDQLLSATSGHEEFVEFEAEISEKYTTIDAEKRDKIERMAAVLAKHFPDADIDVSILDKGFEIEVEGELRLASGATKIEKPWGLRANDLGGQSQFTVYLEKGSGWQAFASDMDAAISFPPVSNYLQLAIKLKGFNGSIFGGGFAINGTPISGYASAAVTGGKVTLSYSGDHWDKAAAGFLFIPQ